MDIFDGENSSNSEEPSEPYVIPEINFNVMSEST